MAIRRQAPKLGEAEYGVYVEDLLSFDLRDISHACEYFGKEIRGEGETAFPPVARLINVIKSNSARRRNAEDDARREAEMEAMREDRRLHPENWVSTAEFMKEMTELANAKSMPKGPIQ